MFTALNDCDPPDTCMAGNTSKGTVSAKGFDAAEGKTIPLGENHRDFIAASFTAIERSLGLSSFPTDKLRYATSILRYTWTEWLDAVLLP